MKEFSLEEYLKNPSRKVVTRDGRDVRIICTDRKGDTPIIALVYNANEGQEYGYAFYSDGKFFRDAGDKLDLFFAPEKHEGWANIYGEFLRGEIFSTKEEAEEYVMLSGAKGFVATAKVEWEE